MHALLYIYYNNRAKHIIITYFKPEYFIRRHTYISVLI